MKKTYRILAVLICVMLLAAGCGKKNTDGPDTSFEDVKAKGKLILGLDDSFPPMGFRDDNNEIVGFDIDAAQEVAKRMGVELVLQPIVWESNVQELNTGNIDCVWNGMSYSESRNEKMKLSEPYMRNTQVVVVLNDSPVQTLADLTGKSVVIQSGSTASEAVDANEDFKKSLGKLTKVADNVQAMMDLKVAGSDAVAMDEVVAKYYMEKNPGEFRVLDEILADENYVVGFRKKDEALCAEIEKQLKAMAADGTLAKISETWMGDDLTTIK